MEAVVERLLEQHYGLTEQNRWAHDSFYDSILATVEHSPSNILNVGAGPTPGAERRLRERVNHLVGVDIDPAVLDNQDLDEAYVTDGIHLPFADQQFDGAYSDWVLEHVEYPAPFLREIYRVLKPGAHFVFRTPNRRHYVSLVAAYTPQWLHELVGNRVRGYSSEAHDPWPTHYRMNDRKAIHRELLAAGFNVCEIKMIEPYPGYRLFHPVAFILGVTYERTVNRSAALAGLRHTIWANAMRPTQELPA